VEIQSNTKLYLERIQRRGAAGPTQRHREVVPPEYRQAKFHLLKDERSPSFQGENNADTLPGMPGKQQNETKEGDERQNPQLEVLPTSSKSVESPKVFRERHNGQDQSSDI
jgi:hypothetical protein